MPFDFERIRRTSHELQQAPSITPIPGHEKEELPMTARSTSSLVKGNGDPQTITVFPHTYSRRGKKYHIDAAMSSVSAPTPQYHYQHWELDSGHNLVAGTLYNSRGIDEYDEPFDAISAAIKHIDQTAGDE